jgi:mono/diheme cytochrome c family protein
MNSMIGRLTKHATLAGLFAAVLAAAPGAHATDSDVQRIRQGLNIAPVPLNLTGLDKNKVGLGSYLVTVAQCNDCHTTPTFAKGGDPFLGDRTIKVVKADYFAGGVFFGGTLCSSNITPDKNGLPDGLTLANFISAMKTGHDFRAKQGVLLQEMPWPYFREMTQSDLAAIYEYLKAIPSNKTPKCP